MNSSYYFSKIYVLIFALCIFFIFINFPKNENPPAQSSFPESTSGNKIISALEKFQDCYNSKVFTFSNNSKDIWSNIEIIAHICDGFGGNLDLRPLRNRDETKWLAFPKKTNLDRNFTMVTLGIANDITAEIKLRDILPQTDFFGADPTNMSQIYTQLGQHFQFGVSGKTGLKNTRIYKNPKMALEDDVKNVNFVEFIDEYVQRKLVHFLWIDIEGGEFEIFEMLYRNGDIDTNHIDICQINFEIHQKTLEEITNEAERFQNFIRKIVTDGKYAIVKAFNVRKQNFVRIFLVNIENAECRRLFID
ncbi:unnamed protein product [Caenorhabditis angaria]|uniref:Methyltransferase FkbM domain-containing protein n=1 Tax=Caenorhabditis angaria TaxID=860376 RepID=A0A9P1I581_9PELO|nr:unnamed protein product [Caenorhabditis angaria]